MTLTSGGLFTIGGGAGATTFTNSGTATSAAGFTLSSGSVTNNSGGTISAAAASTLTIAGGAVTNNSGATLGSATSNLAFSGGTLTTSGPVLANNYTQSGTSVLQTNVTSTTNFGSVASSGTAALGGSLVVNAQPGFSMTNGQTVDLVTSVGTLTTQFGSTSFANFPSNIIPSIVYNTNAVQLDVRETIPVHSHGSHTTIVFTSVQQHNSVLNLRNFQMHSRMPAPEVPQVAATRRFSPDELLASNGKLMAQQANPLIFQKQEQQAQRMQGSGSFSKDPWNVYIGPVASFGDVKSKGDQIGVGYYSAGGLAGFDYILDDRTERPYIVGWGSAVEYRKGWNTAKANSGSTTIDRVHGSLYGTVVPKEIPELAIEAIAGFAFNWDDLKRNTGVNQSLTATAETYETIGDVFFGLEYTFSNTSYTWMPERFAVIPLVTLQYVVDHVSGFTEKDAGIYNLRVGSITQQSLSSLLGSRFTYLFGNANYSMLAQLDAGWIYEYFDQSLIVNYTAFNVNSIATPATTVAPGRNSLLVAADLLSTFPGGWQVEGNCTYQLNSLFYDVFFYLGFGRQF
jgi:hypothetical protein